MVNRGGLVAYGGMIGGFLASVYCCRKRGIPLLQWADVAAPSVVLGTAITRVGCLLFGCDFGARSNLPWAIRSRRAARHGITTSQRLRLAARRASWSYPVHPTQVYESLVGLFLFALLMLIRKYRTFSGQVFLGWVLGYGILRPLIEIVRDDDQRGNVAGAVDVAVHRHRVGRAGGRAAGRAAAQVPPRSGGLAPVAASRGAGGQAAVRRKAEPGGGKRRKRR